MHSAEYGYQKDLGDVDFDTAVERVTEALSAEGFGVLTDIDVKGVFKEKLDEDFRDYRILGACNPNLAFQAIQSEPDVGALLPCNVVVQRAEDGSSTQVTLLKPSAMLAMVDDDAIGEVARDADDRLRRVRDSI